VVERRKGRRGKRKGRRGQRGATLLIIQVGDMLRKETDGKVWGSHVIVIER
jgi:hypothetical protein